MDSGAGFTWEQASSCPAERSPRANKECTTSSQIQKPSTATPTGDFADGSVIVYELREAQQKNGIIFEGDRRRVDVMIKDSNLYKSTGGWRFERFYANDQTQNAVQRCRRFLFCVPRQRQKLTDSFSLSFTDRTDRSPAFRPTLWFV